MKKLNYRKRTIWLVAVWILLFLVVSFATMYYGYTRSVEIARATIKDSLTRVNSSMEELINNEAKIRRNYDLAHANMGHMVKFLQDHGLEEDVPSESRLEEYAALLEANYIAVKDSSGNKVASYGEMIKDNSKYEVTTEEDVHRWLTSGDALIKPEDDLTLFREALKDGYVMEYQISNDATNMVQNEAFSWRAILSDMKFANEAYLIVISGEDDKILVHPDDSMIGKSYDALGFSSKESFLDYYNKPGKNGIAYQKPALKLIDKDDFGSVAEGSINVMGRGSGYMEMEGMYVICNMPQSMTSFYIGQQRGIRIIYALVSLFVLCYILLSFRWMKRHESEPDGHWGRRVIACCIIMLITGTLLSVHAEILSNNSRNKMLKSQAVKLEKEVARDNEKRRSSLDSWYNSINIQTAEVISYTLNRDKKLQNRETIKKLASVFDYPEIYIFGQDGKVRVTNSLYDHIDLNEKRIPRMSDTFLPLLFGAVHNASSPLTDQLSETSHSGSDEAQDTEDAGLGDDVIAYAGVAIRNSEDLSDGCLGISLVSLEELWRSDTFNLGEGDTYQTALGLASSGGRSTTAVTASQLNLIIIVLIHLVICFAAFYVLGVTKGKRGEEISGEGAADTDITALASTSTLDSEEEFFSLFGQNRDRSFRERWNRDNTPILQRTPEKQMVFILECILFVLLIWIVAVFITNGQYLDEHSMIRDVVNGDWKKGMNLYAFTAAEMIIIVAVSLCMAFHSLVYFIARFSTPRGETICHLVYSFITYTAVLVSIYYVLSVFGVQTSTILKGAGIMGIVITFGAQSTIADILAGMFLIFENVIHVGDFVKVGDVVGVVNNIGVRMTKIQSFGTIISVNNSDLKSMQNLSYADSRISSSISIDNREDISRVREIIERELPGIDAKIRELGYTTTDIIYSGITETNENGFTLRFNAFCVPRYAGRATRMLTEEVISMCQRNGIRLAVRRSTLEKGMEERPDEENRQDQ